MWGRGRAVWGSVGQCGAGVGAGVGQCGALWGRVGQCGAGVGAVRGRGSVGLG